MIYIAIEIQDMFIGTASFLLFYHLLLLRLLHYSKEVLDLIQLLELKHAQHDFGFLLLLVSLLCK